MSGWIQSSDCAPCTKSELIYDVLPPVQVAIDDSYTIYTGPKAAVGDGTPLTFEITGSGEDFLDLSQMILRLRVKITKADGRDIVHTLEDGITAGENETVAPVNLWMHSLFSQIDVTLNETLVSQSSNNYAYRAYLSTLLSYGSDAKESWLGMELFESDQAGHMDSMSNTGLTKRKKYVKNGAEVELKGRLHTDLTFQDRLLPNGVTCRITLTRSKPVFNLMSSETGEPGDYMVKITHAMLEARKVKLDPKEQLRIERSILKTGARLPLTHSVIKTFSIPAGVSTYDIESLFMGQIPNRLVLGMVENGAYLGDLTKNPFNFKHFDLGFLVLTVDGKPYPSQPLQPNFNEGHYIDCYETLFAGTGMYGNDLGHGITRDAYAKGYTLFAFNLTPDSSDGSSHVNIRRQGTVRASLQFRTATPTTISLVVFGQCDNVLTVDGNRNILFDYAS